MRGKATVVIHHAEGVAPGASPLTTPIYETTTFTFESAQQVRDYAEGKSDRFLYSRYENPTVVAVERKLAALEQTDAALVFASGMAATSTAVLALARSGDEIVCSSAVYGGTLHLLADLFPNFGLTTRFVLLEDLADPAGVLSDGTRILWFESPINPTLRCVDIRRVADACRARGVTSIIDNTFASPINQQPAALGIDLVMHSATKYLNGHSDVTAGVLAGRQDLIARCAAARRLLGTVLDPQPAYALGRGLKTLHLRMARHNASALALAARFEGDARVRRVYHPGLASHPDHAVARRQMSGFGGMVCLDLGDEEGRACRFYDRLRIFKRAASLGGVESLCSMPIYTSHWNYTPDQLASAGITRGMVRLSVGLEDVEDLIADVDQALE